MAQPFFQIQTAVVTRLRGDATLQAAMTGAVAPNWNILDNVPVNTSFPYLYIADMQGRTGTALAMGPNGKATDVMLNIHIFSQYSGEKEVDAILSAIDDLMNEKTLTLTGGFTNFFCLFDNYIPRVEKDGLTRQGVVRYKLMNQG